MKRIIMILFFAWLTSASAEYNITTVEKEASRTTLYHANGITRKEFRV